MFNMSKVEVYSVLVTLDATNKWKLDGYKHHSLTGTLRAFNANYQVPCMHMLISALFVCRQRASGPRS